MSILDNNFAGTEFVSARNIYELCSWDSPIIEGFETVPLPATDEHFALHRGHNAPCGHDSARGHIVKTIMDHLSAVTITIDRCGRMRMDKDELCNELLDMFEGFLLPETIAEVRRVGIYADAFSTQTDLFYVIHIKRPVQIEKYRTSSILFRFHLKEIQ